MSTYQLEIDGSGAEAGAQRIVRSFDAIKAAADRMEGGVSAAAKKASSSFAEIQKAARPVSDAAIKSLQNLSNVMKTFRAPSDAAVRNTIIFLQGLKSVGAINLGRIAGLASLTAALAGFKGPSSSAGKSTESLLRALALSAGISTGRGLAGTLTALGAYKGPTAAGARSTEALLKALQNFTPPRGLNGAATALEAIARAAQNASGQIRNLNAATVKVASAKINVNTAGASSGIANLTRSHGLLHGAIFKTQTMYHALGGILAGRAFIMASNSIIKIQAQLEAATGSVQQARVQFDFLREQTQKLGLEFTETARSYGFFLGAIKGTGVSFKDAREIFTGFSVAARALQLSVSDVDGIFRALGQIMSKGKLQAEELRGQLGDRLPGAFTRFAAALDMTKPGELDKALKDGAISGKKLQDAILQVARTMEIEFMGSAEKMSKTVDASFNRLKNAFTFSAADAGQNGLNAAIISITDSLTKLLQSQGLNDFMRVVAQAFKVLGENIETVAFLLGGAAVFATLKWLAGLTLLTKAMGVLNTVTKAFLGLRIAASLAGTIGAVGTLTTAMVILGNVIRAHPIFFLASALIAGYAAWRTFQKGTKEADEAMRSFGGATTTADNLITSYMQTIYNASDSLAENTRQLRINTEEKIRNAQAALQDVNLNVQGVRRVGGNGAFGANAIGWGITPKAEAGKIAIGGTVIKEKEAASLLGRLLTKDGRGTGINSNADAVRLARTVREAGAYVEQGGKYADQINAVLAPAKRQLELAVRGDFKGGTFEGVNKALGNAFGDFNREFSQPAVIQGDPLEKIKKDKKGGGGKSEAEKDYDDLVRNIRQAEKAMTDLETTASSTLASVGGLLSGSLNTVSAAAQAAAQSQLKTFEDGFETAQKAQAGVMALARQLQATGKIDPSVDVSSYDAAKVAATGYMQSLQQVNVEREKGLESSKLVASMREESAVRIATTGVMLDYKKTSNEVARARELEAAIAGQSMEINTYVIDGVKKEMSYRDYLFIMLGREIDVREKLNRVDELGARRRDYAGMREINEQMRPIQASGASEEDLTYYREMFELRQKFIDQGSEGTELRQRVAVEAAIKNEERAQAALNKELEKGRQFSADMADALVGGLRDALSGNKGFLDSFKEMFKQLKNIVLDFVLYNPLKEFLTGTLTGAMSSAAGGATGYSSGSGVSPSSSAGSILQKISQSFAGGDTPMSTSSPVLANGGMNVAPNGDIIVTATKATSVAKDLFSPIASPQQQKSQGKNFFEGAKKIFDFQKNGADIKKFADSFKKGGAKAGTGASGAIAAVGQAYAAYTMGNAVGKGVAKALGGGFRTQAVAGGITGGAAAGYSLGGPVGAAVGAVLGGVMGLLKKKPKIASSFGAVSVGDTGFAGAGAGGKFGAGDAKAGGAMASAGASLFNRFALDFDAKLQAGKYGSFGSREFAKGKGAESFYSLTGTTRKGRPNGREGVDWVKGSDSEVQAFALINQVKKGVITGLTNTISTVFANTKANNMENLNADLDVGKAYDSFVKGSFKLSDVATQVSDLNETFRKLSRQSAQLGLNEEKLAKARDRLMGQMKEDFNFQISQGILGITDPARAGYNALVKEYRDTVESAMAVGGDLVQVETLFGLKRVELAKQFADTATNGMVTAAKELLTSLTATSASPLNAGTVLNNASSLYGGLRSELQSGNYANAGQLSSYTQNYLDSARSAYGSSSQYFDIFQSVTEFLQDMSAITGAGPGGDATTSVPSLPSLSSLVEEITRKNQEVVSATGQVGAAVVEGTTSIVEAIHDLGRVLGNNIVGGPSPGPSAPSAGGSVGSIGSGLSVTSGSERTIRGTVNLV